LRDGVDVSNSGLGYEPFRAGNYARIDSYKMCWSNVLMGVAPIVMPQPVV